jgi:hypothetical protein
MLDKVPNSLNAISSKGRSLVDPGGALMSTLKIRGQHVKFGIAKQGKLLFLDGIRETKTTQHREGLIANTTSTDTARKGLQLLNGRGSNSIFGSGVLTGMNDGDQQIIKGIEIRVRESVKLDISGVIRNVETLKQARKSPMIRGGRSHYAKNMQRR